mgnify:CR=1 FL=1
MAKLFSQATYQALDSDGDPINGAKLNFYLTGTSTRHDTYTDNALSVAHTNPVVADSSGRFAPIYLQDADYKVVLTLADDTVVQTIDPVHGAEAVDPADLTTANVFTKTVTWKHGDDVASAAALSLGDGNIFDITGTTAITSIGTKGIGTVVILQFDGSLTLTHNATDLVLPGAQNIQTSAGDIAVLWEYASGDWRLASYQRAVGPIGGTALQTSATYTVLTTDHGKTIKAFASSTAITITLPAASAAGDGFEITVVKTDTTVNTVTIDGNGAETITAPGGERTTVVLASFSDRLKIVCNGTKWHTVDHRITFESTEQTITAAGSLTIPHGLGVQPKNILAWVINTTADLNYSVGDLVYVDTTSQDATTATGVSIVPDATNLNIRFGSNANVFTLLDKTTGNVSGITASSWNVVFKCWL